MEPMPLDTLLFIPSGAEIGLDQFKTALVTRGGVVEGSGPTFLQVSFRSTRLKFKQANNVTVSLFVHPAEHLKVGVGEASKMTHPWCVVMTLLDQDGNAMNPPSVSDFPANVSPVEFERFCTNVLRSCVAELADFKGIEKRPSQPAKEANKAKDVPAVKTMADMERLAAAEQRRERKQARRQAQIAAARG